jgi:hypothetical protein
MSKRAADFVEEWIGENAVRPVEGAPEGDDSEARLRAEECLAAAKEEGIAKEDIEEEIGDIVDYMSGVIAKLVDRPEIGRQVLTDDSREQFIRTKAFYIWLEEGCPEGRADVHWHLASEFVATEENRLNELAPTSEPIAAPLGATENPDELPTRTDQEARPADNNETPKVPLT